MMSRIAWLPGWIVAIAVCLVDLAIVVGRTSTDAFAHVSKIPNEGWNAYHAVAAMTGGVLYPPPGSFVFNNYPPLSFYIVGLAGQVVGDPIAAGRILSAFGLIAASVAIGVAAFRLGAGALGAVAAAGMAGLLGAGLYPGYVGTNDPQWFGHALMITGLTLFVAKRPSLAVDIAACVLMVAAGLIKHNLVPVPLAATLWLLVHDRARLRRWVAIGAVLAGLALAALFAAYGGAVFDSVLHHERIVAVRRIFEFRRVIFVPLLPMAWIACAILWMAMTQPAARLAALYLLIAATTGIAALAGEGVWWNAAFDTVLALALAGGLVVGWIARLAPASRGLAATLAVLALVMPFARVAEAGVWAMIQFRRDMPALEAQGAATVRALAAEPGPVSCEALALCFWAGKPFLLDAFNADQRARRRPEAKAALREAMEAGRLGALQLPASGAGDLWRLVRLVAPEIPQRWAAHPLPNGGTLLVPPR